MNVVHLHLLMNHLPVLGSFFALLLFAGALYRKSVSLRFALWFTVALGAAAIVVYLTGGPTAENLEKLVGITEQSIERHEEAAEIATFGAGALGALALLTLFVFRRREIPRWVGVSGLAGLTMLAAVMGWTANLGGQIRHSEIRGVALPGSHPTQRGDSED